MAEQEIEELAGQIGLSVAELSHILTRDQWHVDYMVRLGYHPRRAEELVLFRIVEAEWPQCRRCQALSYWGSGNLEWMS